jgi:hypothetical protein
MVFFRHPAETGSDGTGRVFNDPERMSMEAFERIPAELCAEQGLAYLRLLTQLARCGLDAAGPPLMGAAQR